MKNYNTETHPEINQLSLHQDIKTNKDHLLTKETKENIIKKIAKILPSWPLEGDTNLVFLTDTSAVPFGWAFKEYFDKTAAKKQISQKQIPKFLRIDVNSIKHEGQFIKDYFTYSEVERIPLITHKRNNLMRSSFALTKKEAEQKITEAINFSKNLIEKLKDKLKILCQNSSNTTLTIFDEFLPLQISLTDSSIYGALTVPLAKFFLNKTCQELKIEPKFYYAGLDMDAPWSSGHVSVKNAFNQEKISDGYLTAISPIVRRMRTDNPNEYLPVSTGKAEVAPKLHQKNAKLLIQEMKEIGRKLAEKI